MEPTRISCHLSVLQGSSLRFSSAPIFKITATSADGRLNKWEDISYSQFAADIELVAKYWHKTLSLHSVGLGSVVGLLLSGWSYTDVVQIYGVSRAGYVPQLFSLQLPNPDAIFELLAKGDAKALICDRSSIGVVQDAPIPVYSTTDPLDIGARMADIPLPAIEIHGHADNVMMIFHTSGSTSGSPKVIPYLQRWIIGAIKKAEIVCRPKRTVCSDVTTWIGSICHIGQTFMFLGYMQHGACTILPSRQAFTSEELNNMITFAGLNRLSNYLQLDELFYIGSELGSSEKEWAYSKGLRLKASFSRSSSKRHWDVFKPTEGVACDFSPIESTSNGKFLLELIVLQESIDCPPPSLCSSDGHYHTGDFFEEIISGHYVYRGHNDDWIKCKSGLRCDAKFIEDQVKSVCGSLVLDCIVIRHGRPSPVLILEPLMPEVDQERLKQDIYNRIQPLQARCYLHERIEAQAIIVA
ncbi:hypothetical protein M422DRAFT_76814 [Sphaerobolus stellatus SS14]|uniref:AMP-dependent synthetase/ligase domain-containing protein n=1 Tax=Sphaerobolus stellatus (strain SS14) TaxID=990650 RepID=A0A0C9UIY1_SPHS4|nr:hypothetical protein M422DRAFT_76814 [Sphaerobolus stellatus SS14]